MPREIVWSAIHTAYTWLESDFPERLKDTGDVMSIQGTGGVSPFSVIDLEELQRRTGSALPMPMLPELTAQMPGLWGFDADALSDEALPAELKEFIDAHSDTFGESVDTPDELRQLLQMLHQGEQGAGLPRLDTQGKDLESIGDADMLAMLIDYLANFARNENKQRSVPTRSRMIGNNGFSGGGTPSYGGGGSGGGVSPGGNSVSGPNLAGPVPAPSGEAVKDTMRWKDAVMEYGRQNGISEADLPEFTTAVLACIGRESGGNPNAVGDGGNSIGLFQMNMAGGAGSGYTAEQLKDPNTQFKAMIPQFAAAFKDAKAQGISGRDIAAYFAQHVERCASQYYGAYPPWYDKIATGAGSPSVTPATMNA